MPRKKEPNPTIGHVDCIECGKEAVVRQTSKGGYLYTYCKTCGTDQRYGQAVQNRLWSTTRWIDGEPENKPRNLSGTVRLPEPVQEPTPEPVGNRTTPEPVQEPIPEPAGSKKEKGWGWGVLALVGTLGLLALTGGAKG